MSREPARSSYGYGSIRRPVEITEAEAMYKLGLYRRDMLIRQVGAKRGPDDHTCRKLTFRSIDQPCQRTRHVVRIGNVRPREHICEVLKQMARDLAHLAILRSPLWL